MRTKAIILSAAVLAAGVASSMAQSNVYSLNVVGYVNVTVKPGFNAIANPLDDGAGNMLTNVIGGTDINNVTLPDGSILYPWSGHSYGNGITYYDSYGWFDANLGGYSTNTVPPGSGLFLLLPHGTNATVTFVGTVKQGTNSNALSAGYYLTASAYPVALPPGVAGDGLAGQTLQLPVQDGDILYTYDPTTQFYGYTFYGGYGWFDPNNSNLSTNGPVIPVASSFFTVKQSAGTWTQSFSVR